MYKEIVRPILNKFDSETFHDIARESLHIAEISPLTLRLLEFFAFKHKRFADPRLHVDLGGLKLENPLVVGAGWDKAGRAILGLWHLGFACVEVGSVLEFKQPGNPKPRLFMVSNGAAINWLGFNSPGMDLVSKNLNRYEGSGVPIGISIGLNKDANQSRADESYAAVAEKMYPYADYFAVNVSSPNTPGLRKLQTKQSGGDILKAVNEAMEGKGGRKPLFIKIAPELSFKEIDDIIEIALDHSIKGIVASNTANVPELKARYGERWRNERGGLSGDDEEYRLMTTRQVARIYRQAGDRLEIMGVGGVNSAETALEKIRAGAKALQLVTAIRGEGTAVAGKINSGIVEYMEREGVKTLGELLGVDAGKYDE